MSGDTPLTQIETSAASSNPSRTPRPWIWRRICSQNPFYLLSVCFALHGLARWVHTDTGEAFSPWPLLGLTAGYTLLLATTGFVIVRFGQVWDDARSILLLILLLFVEMSLTFDDTLVRDPATGRLLLLAGLTFAVVLSEFLLRGLRIALPWLYRLPYHAMLALLFLYPTLLTGGGPPRLSAATISWGIFLFPVVAASVLLTLLPAIRRGSEFMRDNGTPWLWPWYPWSLFVFLAVCLGFRAYALSLSFDPVLSLTLDQAMKLESAFGMYYLVPLVFATGILLLEIGQMEKSRLTVGLAMLVPLVCLYMSVPAEIPFGPYDHFLQQLVHRLGSPIFLAVLGTIAFHGYAMVRGVQSAEVWLTFILFSATRVSPQTVGLSTIAPTQWWPVLALAFVQLAIGLRRGDSHRIFVGIAFAIVAMLTGMNNLIAVPTVVQPAALFVGMTTAVLVIGASFTDEFAWLLRVFGALLLVLATIGSWVLIQSRPDLLPVWTELLLVSIWAIVAFGYGRLVHMRLYRLSTTLCIATSSIGLLETAVVYLIRESSWNGATSFAMGLGWFALAFAISSWKAGWITWTGSGLLQDLTFDADA